MPLPVSVVIPNFNNFALLRECLISLSRSELAGAPIIVVDNASTEAGLEQVRAEFASVEWICLKNNQGYAGGANAGLRASAEPYIFLLNNDANVRPNGWQDAVAALEADPTIGAVQPAILLAGTGILNNLGLEVNIFGLAWDREYRKPYVPAEPAVEIPAFSGAAVLLRRSAVSEAGLFDGRYFMYHEDVDLSLRLRLARFRILTFPSAVVEHHYSYKRSAQRYFFLERNRWWSILKNYPAGALLLLLPGLVILELGLLVQSVAERWFWKKLQASGAVLCSLGRIWHQRRETPRRLGSGEFFRGFQGTVSFSELPDSYAYRSARVFMSAYAAVFSKLIPGFHPHQSMSSHDL